MNSCRNKKKSVFLVEKSALSEAMIYQQQELCKQGIIRPGK